MDEYIIPTPEEMNVSKIDQELVAFVINEFSKQLLSQRKGNDDYHLQLEYSGKDKRRLNKNEIAYIENIFISKGWNCKLNRIVIDLANVLITLSLTKEEKNNY